MKKTLTVNISGIVFHMDEDAYDILHDYLQSIRKHFSKTEGGDEIASDIEARIAEMLKERIGDERQVITIDDIEEVIRVIGLPEEFGEEFAEDTTNGTSHKRSAKSTKRLYRDPENEVLGGVCGGLGAYFHVDPVWFRLAFILACIPGLGTPLLIYLVLWIIIPQANTAAERLEMKGEKVNISNIEKSIREEINNLKNKFNQFTREAKRTYKKKSAAHRSDFQGVEHVLSRILHLFVRLILIILGFIFTVISIALILSLLVLILGFGLGFDLFVFDSEVVNISILQLSEIFIGPPATSIIFQLSLLLTLFIPIGLLLFLGIRFIFGMNRIKYMGQTAFYVWLVSLIICTFYGISLIRDFSHESVIDKTHPIEISNNKMIEISALRQNDFDRIIRFGDYFELDDINAIIAENAPNTYYGLPFISFEKSPTNKAGIEIFYKARGKSRHHAEQRAERTHYEYSVSGNEIALAPCFTLSDKDVWRKQQVNVVVRLPEGTVFTVDQKLQRAIDREKHSPYRITGGTWIMTDQGAEEYQETPHTIPGDDESMEPETSKLNSKKSTGLIFSVTRNISQLFWQLTAGI